MAREACVMQIINASDGGQLSVLLASCGLKPVHELMTI
jgi:hypothetical protein